MEQIKPVTFASAGSHPIQLEGSLHCQDGQVSSQKVGESGGVCGQQYRLHTPPPSFFEKIHGQGQWPAAVICHPHPLGGGSMHNSVVWAIAHALATRGVMALRFNFRGVGRSGGQHDHGRGERADVAGALDWLFAHPEVDPWRVSLVGYSFGAWVGLAQAQTDARVAALAAVGLAAWHYDAEFSKNNTPPDLGTDAWDVEPNFLRSYTRPKLFVTGELDAFSPPGVLRRWVDGLLPPREIHVMERSDHFMQGHEREVGELVGDFLGGLQTRCGASGLCVQGDGQGCH